MPTTAFQVLAIEVAALARHSRCIEEKGAASHALRACTLQLILPLLMAGASTLQGGHLLEGAITNQQSDECTRSTFKRLKLRLATFQTGFEEFVPGLRQISRRLGTCIAVGPSTLASP
jgi:hypothetical protein